MIEEATQHDVLICDSFSQEWNGRGGCLELVDEAAKQFNGNSYLAWGTVTPMHNEFIKASRDRIVDYLLDVAGGAFNRKKLSVMDDDDLVMVLKASALSQGA